MAYEVGELVFTTYHGIGLVVARPSERVYVVGIMGIEGDHSRLTFRIADEADIQDRVSVPDPIATLRKLMGA